MDPPSGDWNPSFFLASSSERPPIISSSLPVEEGAAEVVRDRSRSPVRRYVGGTPEEQRRTGIIPHGRYGALPPTLEQRLDSSLATLKARGFLGEDFVESARECTPLNVRGAFVRQAISKFIEDGDSHFNRLLSAVENRNTFEVFIRIANQIKRNAVRVGADDLITLAKEFVEVCKADDRQRELLLPKYRQVKLKFDEIKAAFRADILQCADEAEGPRTGPVVDVAAFREAAGHSH